MPDNVVVGIHSSVNPGTQGSFNQFIDGHSWISVTRNGVTTNYGLWPDDHPMVPNNGSGTDIRVGMEDGQTPSASRYYQLNETQAANLERALQENVTWGYTNTCASWASDTVSRVTGQRIDASEFLFTDTPRQLIQTIRDLEQQRATSPTDPIRPDEITRGSSSFGAVDVPSDTRHARQGDWQQIHDAVARNGLDGTQRDNVAAAAYAQFGRELPRIDRVGVYGNEDRLVGTHAPQGFGNEPMHNASVSIHETRERPAMDSMAQVAEQVRVASSMQPTQARENDATGVSMRV